MAPLATAALFTGAIPDAIPAGGEFSDTALTSSPEGGWGNIQYPRAICDGSIVYLPYVSGEGNASVLRWDLDAGSGASIVLDAIGEVDDHDAPSVIQRGDGTFLAVWSEHNGDVFVSTSEDGATWTEAANITSQIGSYTAGQGYTYPRLWESGGTVHLWLRYGFTSGETVESTSTDGTTWTGRSEFYSGPYLYMTNDGAGRIDVATRVNSSEDGKVGHGYLEAGTWYDSAGNELPVPFDDDDLTTVVTYDGTHRVGTWDIAPGPVIACGRWVTADTSDFTYKYATRSGSSWDVEDVATVGSTSGNLSGYALDPVDPSIVYLSRRATKNQMYQYRRVHGEWPAGLVRTITASAVDQRYPIVPLDADPRLRVAWLDGTWTSAFVFATGISAWIRD